MKNYKERGYSLIEVLLGITILTMGSLFLFGMFPASELAISDAQNTYSATELAREKLEYWIEKGYTTILAQPATVDSGTVNMQVLDSGATGTYSFTYQVTHSTVVAGEVELVEAFVSWRQMGGIISGYGSFGVGGATTYLNSVRLSTWSTPTWVTP